MTVRSARFTIHAVEADFDCFDQRAQTVRTHSGCDLLASFSQLATARRT